jgi:hypothetical protein
MHISDKALDEFIAIYEEEFGEKLDRQAATDMAHRILALYRLLRRKLPGGRSATQSVTQQHADADPPIESQT